MIPNNYQLMAQRLPVYGHKADFMRLLDQHNCIIMIGETGSGKTTQVPQWCVEYVKKKKISSGGQLLKVVCTQPRRIATVSVARRVADEMGVTVRIC
jgi:pre-mRNA-splicing factor ATP-dependent RNA helicase DHX15/PRP43